VDHLSLRSRREILKTAALAAAAVPVMSLPDAALAAAAPAAPANDRMRGLKIGVASYTLRKMQLDDAIKAIRRVGLSYVSIKDFHLPLKSTPDQRREVAKKCRDAGITPLSCGVITMSNNEANIRDAFEYAKDAGIPTIVCSPAIDSMPILDKMVKEYDIKLAIHNHGPGDNKYATPYDAMKLIEKYDPRIGLCIDVGHTGRMKVDPAKSILDCRARLHDVHLKDINVAEARGSCVESGRGVLDLKAIMHALVEIKFTGLAAFEYEKDESDPIPGLAESVGYTKGLLVGMGD
jgi:inosose dehydratase